MTHKTLAVFVTVLLAVSALLVLAPVFASQPPGASVSPSVAQPAASITYTLLDGYGSPTTSFYPGVSGGGTLYFTVTDRVDRAVNVTVTDPNAARDGVSSPAFHYEATLNTTTFTFNSYTAGVGYTFPTDLPYGGHWTVNFSAPSGGTVDQNVSVFLYHTELSTSIGTGATLPGQAVTIFWTLLLDSNDASLYTRSTNVWIFGMYNGNGTAQDLFSQGRIALTPASAGQGEWNVTVPANTTPVTHLRIQVYAITNVSGQVAENASANVTVDVGSLAIENYGVTLTPPNCTFGDTTYFATGSEIAGCVQIGAAYHAIFTPISGLPVTVGYWDGTALVTPSGAPTALTTNASGEAAFTFLATSPPFITVTQYPVYDALNFTTTVPGASTHYVWTQWLNATWTLTGGSTGSGVVRVALDHTQYYAGAVATVTWSIGSSNVSSTGPVSAIGWTVTGPGGITYLRGALNATASSGTFPFPVTEAMASHTIEVWIYAANATQGFSNYASALVLTPSLLLTPAALYYTPGSTALVTVVLNGGGAGATIAYEAVGYWTTTDGVVGNGTVANGSSVSLVVPSTAPPVSIVVNAWASIGGQVIASASTAVLLEQGYTILLGVTTVSSYSDGSFQPGQTVTLSFSVVAEGGAALPQVFTFELLAMGYPYTAVIQSTSPSGTTQFTIPSNAVQGTLVLELVARGTLSAGPCFPSGTCAGITALYVNPSPSVLNLEVGAGSGVTVGWLILLVLILVIAFAVALYVALRRRGRGGRPSSTTALNPPAPAPSTPPAQEWSEPASPSPPPPIAVPGPGDSGTPPRLPEPPAPPSA